MQTFKVVESYLHKAAKDVVLGWLRAAAEKADSGMDWFEVRPVRCRTNRAGPGFGIWPEWPITQKGPGFGAEFVWDEVWPIEGEPAPNAPPPTPAEVMAAGYRLAAVIDIGVMHKGRLGCAVEIVHKHPVPQWKRDLLASYDVPLVEVCALAVLKQIEPRPFLPLWTPSRKTAAIGLSPREIAEDYRAFLHAYPEVSI